MNTERSTLSVECQTALGLTLALFAASVQAGELNVTGDMSVASNLTAHAVTIGGETRTNWPSGGNASGAVDLTTAVLDFSESEPFFRYTLTNNTTWIFTNHVAGREIKLQVSQNEVGGWTNIWPANLLWPGGQTVPVSSHPNHFDLFKIVDNGTHWLGSVHGSDYRVPCVSNCNYGLLFDGSQNSVSAAADASFFPIEAFTFEFWAKDSSSVDGAGYIGAVESFEGPNGGNGWHFRSADELRDVQFYWNNEGVQIALDSYPTNIGGGEWHHVAASFDGTTVRLFIDGAVVSSAAATITAPSPKTLVFSCPGYFNDIGAEVTLDEVRISSVVRYTSTFTPAHSFTVDSDTVAYYKFNEGSGSTAHDETSNHDATLHGSPTPTWEEED